MWRLLAACALAAASCAFAQSPSFAPFSGAPQAASLEDEERRLWDESADADTSLRRRGSLYGDAALDSYLQDVLDDLFPEFGGAVRIKTVNDPALNAFALPNGSLYIHLGMLARLENEAQLATVLAHEGAHFVHRHGYLHRQNAKSASAFALGVGMVGGAVGILGQLAAVSSVFGYSQEHEREADRVGFERIARLGYDTREAGKVFEILREEARILEHKEPFLFASHPKLDERVQSFKELRELHPAAQAGRRTETERFLTRTGAARRAWIEQAFGRSLYKTLIYVLDQPGAVERYPAHAPYYLGEAYRLRNEEGDPAKAMAAYQRALRDAPQFASTYKALGMLYLQQDNKQEARTMFQRYLDMAADGPDTAFIRSYLRQLQ
jgi:predicted Zn-dependent protease